jgi:hypothetical protein
LKDLRGNLDRMEKTMSSGIYVFTFSFVASTDFFAIGNGDFEGVRVSVAGQTSREYSVTL